jgi:hypothetical protein
MSSKSKRNRKYTSQIKREPGISLPAHPPYPASSLCRLRQHLRTQPPIKRIQGQQPMIIPADVSFLKDLKWIILVALIVTILLVISYYLFR